MSPPRQERQAPVVWPSVGDLVVVSPARRSRWLRGTGVVVGPDPVYFPCPVSVFVAFPAGRTVLLDVGELLVTRAAPRPRVPGPGAAVPSPGATHPDPGRSPVERPSQLGSRRPAGPDMTARKAR